MMIEVTGERPTVVTIPPGVAHGVFSNTTLRHLYGLTVAWEGDDDDLGCRYDVPTLDLNWPSASPLVLQRDLDLPDFAKMMHQFETATIFNGDVATPHS